MRLKAISLFLAIQVLSFGIWQTTSSHNEVLANEPVAEVHPASEKDQSNVDFSIRNFNESIVNLNIAQKKKINEALRELPEEHASSVEKIVLDYNKNAGRGLGGNNLIILRGINMSYEELIGVLIHETAHNVDYDYLSPKKMVEKSGFKDGPHPLYITDPSIDFYRISWENELNLKNTASNLDFVSGYAMSDPFEDFAETYTYYVLHNADFKALAVSSPKLYAKYRFMKYRVFSGVEFDTGDGIVNLNNRSWDTTILNYSLSDFLT